MECPLLVLASAILATGRGQDVEAQSECFSEHCGRTDCAWWIPAEGGRCSVAVVAENLDDFRLNGLRQEA